MTRKHQAKTDKSNHSQANHLLYMAEENEEKPECSSLRIPAFPREKYYKGTARCAFSYNRA